MPIDGEAGPSVVMASAQELNDAPIVYGWAVTRCENPDCPALHVYLLGEMDRVIAQMALDEPSAAKLMLDIHLAMVGQERMN